MSFDDIGCLLYMVSTSSRLLDCFGILQKQFFIQLCSHSIVT